MYEEMDEFPELTLVCEYTVNYQGHAVVVDVATDVEGNVMHALYYEDMWAEVSASSLAEDVEARLLETLELNLSLEGDMPHPF